MLTFVMIWMYDVPCGIVDWHVVEGVEVVREGRVHSQVGHCQDPDVGVAKYLDFH